MEAVTTYKEKVSEASGTSAYVPFASQSSSSFQIPKPIQRSREEAPFQNQPIPAAAVAKIGDRLHLSQHKTELLATGIRSLTGRKSIEPGLREKLSQRKEEGREFFSIRKCPMDVKGETRRKDVSVFFLQRYSWTSKVFGCKAGLLFTNRNNPTFQF